MENIRVGLLLTPREHRVYLGGSPLTIPSNTKEWDIPEGVRQGLMTLEQVVEARKSLGHTGSLNLQLFFGQEHRMGFTLPELTQEGLTVSDPKIVELDHKTGEIIRELSSEEETRYYDYYRSMTENPPPDREIANTNISTEGKN